MCTCVYMRVRVCPTVSNVCCCVCTQDGGACSDLTDVEALMKSYQISCRRRKKDGVCDVMHGSHCACPAHPYVPLWCMIAPPTPTYHYGV